MTAQDDPSDATVPPDATAPDATTLDATAPPADAAAAPVVGGRKRYLRLVLRVGFLVAVLAFGGLALRGQYSEVRTSVEQLNWWSALAAVLLAEASIVLSMLSWRRVLADLGSPLPFAAASRIYFVGQLGKYLPGSIWPVLAQMELGRDHAVPRARTAAAALVAIGLGLVSTLLVAGALLPFAVQATVWRLVVLAGLAVGLVVASPPVLNRILARGMRLLRRPPLERPLSPRGIVVATGYAAAGWVLQGLAVYVLALPLLSGGDGVVRLAVLSVGGYAVASAAGIVVLIAPAGLGVREPALIAALTAELTAAAALVVVLAARLVVSVADLGTGAVLAMLPAPRRGRPYAEAAAPPK